MAGAYCDPQDVIDLANVVEDTDLTEIQVLSYMVDVQADINAALVGFYDCPFGELTPSDPISWDVSDKIPPLIVAICKKMATGIAIEKLFSAKAGKNKSPYGEHLLKEGWKKLQELQYGYKNLLDTDGNVIARRAPADSNAATYMSEETPTDPTQVMPDMYEPYPDYSESDSSD